MTSGSPATTKGREDRRAAASRWTPGRSPTQATGGGSDENDDDIIDEGPLDEYDRMLRARLFEAQRKSHQCTFRGVMAKGRALLEEEDDEEGE
jgi:hypothetical protein